jgi:hypothetical protein
MAILQRLFFLSLGQASWLFPRHTGAGGMTKGRVALTSAVAIGDGQKPQVIQRFSSPWVGRRPGANPDFLLRGPRQRPRMRLSVKESRTRTTNATESDRKSQPQARSASALSCSAVSVKNAIGPLRRPQAASTLTLRQLWDPRAIAPLTRCLRALSRS